MHVDDKDNNKDNGPDEEQREEAPHPVPSLWEEARRHAVLGVAGAAGPLLVALADGWLRTH
ncbi:hypothetical protein [Streptomyces sp. NPDC051704]|uniref:hypothetical protein n=1 Tax=Streptomyces sp. NPDC051704 TaxID=3365671 RepID=UPI0037B14A67